MRFRLGLLLGLAIGYVMGSKAGRERYVQIQRAWHSVSGSEPAQQLRSDMKDVASRAGHAIETKASEGAAKVTEMVHGDDRTSSTAGNRQ